MYTVHFTTNCTLYNYIHNVREKVDFQEYLGEDVNRFNIKDIYANLCIHKFNSYFD